jgi:hypothetical protein
MRRVASCSLRACREQTNSVAFCGREGAGLGRYRHSAGEAGTQQFASIEGQRGWPSVGAARRRRLDIARRAAPDARRWLADPIAENGRVSWRRGKAYVAKGRPWHGEGHTKRTP